jgi:hypothetical protein
LWIFVVSIKFSLCSHQVRNGFPNVFQVGPHFILYAFAQLHPFFVGLCAPGLLAFLQLHPFGTGGKHWSYMFEVNTSILGEFPKFAELSAMGKSKRLMQN